MKPQVIHGYVEVREGSWVNPHAVVSIIGLTVALRGLRGKP